MANSSLLYESIGDKHDFTIGTTVSTSGASVRAGFIRKVYGILAAQLTLNCFIAYECMYFEPIFNTMTGDNTFVTLSLIALSIITLIGTMVNANTSPANMIWLFLFTVVESFLVGKVCAQYQAVGKGNLVLIALIATAFIFISLTIYVMLSDQDFSFMGGALFVSLIALIAFPILNFIFYSITGKQSKIVNILYSTAGAIVFALYIIYDTDQIMKRMSPDQYIEAVLNLYLDLINLFLYILQILAEADNN